MTMMDSDKAGSTHRGVWDDPEASYAARLGLTHIARVLAYILASVDERIGFIEKRADLARIPLPPSFAMEDPADERYFALYSLVHGDITQASERASETERAAERAEQERQHAARIAEDIDERLATLERRADDYGIPPVAAWQDEAIIERYFAFYSCFEPTPSETERAAERDGAAVIFRSMG